MIKKLLLGIGVWLLVVSSNSAYAGHSGEGIRDCIRDSRVQYRLEWRECQDRSCKYKARRAHRYRVARCKVRGGGEKPDNGRPVPEINAASSVPALALAVGLVLLYRERKQKHVKS